MTATGMTLRERICEGEKSPHELAGTKKDWDNNLSVMPRRIFSEIILEPAMSFRSNDRSPISGSPQDALRRDGGARMPNTARLFAEIHEVVQHIPHNGPEALRS